MGNDVNMNQDDMNKVFALNDADDINKLKTELIKLGNVVRNINSYLEELHKGKDLLQDHVDEIRKIFALRTTARQEYELANKNIVNNDFESARDNITNLGNTLINFKNIYDNLMQVIATKQNLAGTNTVNQQTTPQPNQANTSTLPPLMTKFKRFFENTPANLLRSVDFGKSLFSYFNPRMEVPSDPAELLKATKALFEIGSYQGTNFKDEDFVRFVVDKVNNDPGLMTFDMIADLVESDAYQNFGKHALSADHHAKSKFKNWVTKKSMLSKINQTQDVDVVLNADGLKRVVNKLVQEKQKGNYFKEIDQKIEQFDETYVKHQSQDALKELQANASSGRRYADAIKGVNQILCNEDTASLLNETIDSAVLSAKKPKEREALKLGIGIHTNKILCAVAQRKSWTNEELKSILIKSSVEKNAEKFEQKAEQINTQSQGEVVETKKQVNNNNDFHPVLDVAKTFGLSLVGSATISTITAIPGVGQVVGPLVGLATVVGAGVGSLVSTYQQEKQKGEVTKAQARKIAMRAGFAMVRKAVPYAVASAFGPYGRTVGASMVFAKTLFNDLARRAGVEKEEVHGIKNKIKSFGKKLKAIGHNVNLVDGFKSLTYAAAKGGAMYLGASVGAKLGSEFSPKLSEFGSKVGDKFKGIFNRQSESPVVSNDEQVLMDTYENNRSYEDVQKNYHQRYQDLCNDEDLMDTYENNRSYEDVQKIYNQRYQDDMIKNLSPESLAELDALNDKIELTPDARSTADVNNHRQYVDGVKQDWYTHAEQAKAVDLLEHAGVEDPMGVLRKLGSAARFFGGEYQSTLDHLCAGNLNNQDVENIIESLSLINEEGGLASGVTVPMPAHNQTFGGASELVTETVVLPKHGQTFENTVNEVVTESVPLPNVNHDSILQETVEDSDDYASVRMPEHGQLFGTTENSLDYQSDTSVTENVTESVTDNNFPWFSPNLNLNLSGIHFNEPVNSPAATEAVVSSPEHELSNGVTVATETSVQLPEHGQFYESATKIPLSTRDL
ncbi:MAG: hypothetical protein J6B20_00720 [Clostridia bacterium]|nr:hypothetical protein [Clostridia bacterium]